MVVLEISVTNITTIILIVLTSNKCIQLISLVAFNLTDIYPRIKYKNINRKYKFINRSYSL